MISQSKKRNQQRQPLSHLTHKTKIQHFHAMWLSDVHLGSIDCKAEFLLHFLNHSQCDYLYLVGDIVDVWALKKRVYWPDSHDKVIKKILELAASGTQVIYIPGNHDEAFKAYADSHFRGVTLAKQHIHESINGKRFLMLHGDQFDSQVCVSRVYAKLGDHLYDVLLWLNRQLHSVRSSLGYPYWSLASYIKLRVNKAQQAINQYRDAVLRYAAKKQVDMVICGHIHQPELSQHTLNQHHLIYANDGDWVENCTLIAETHDGNVQLLKWNEQTLQAETVTSIELSHLHETPIAPQKQHVA
ncbi:UDP-2,3-diacylglucosamine diphosphatase [Shewanella inventionis]|uniref:UDP-2,3-diacylglucosamine hydrolase n=1 Tax=Shewanella inventionis TaxID=1738770 RepID=A0ABQ1IQU5_9GAMM|nr:UDP-2,3-diacylglucosamine diphosphatase [Shewanella inventionis]MCL1157147.1 UDP-2,3-diacylglucosamine diphosphatase [Shewanella inventionis]GGB49463.1 UDP-2,3-diacylglucosamine hydrolase [Shewanella inventionis]